MALDWSSTRGTPGDLSSTPGAPRSHVGAHVVERGSAILWRLAPLALAALAAVAYLWNLTAGRPVADGPLRASARPQPVRRAGPRGAVRHRRRPAAVGRRAPAAGPRGGAHRGPRVRPHAGGRPHVPLRQPGRPPGAADGRRGLGAGPWPGERADPLG